ncbi:hypothetical protein D922_01121 [Enterococcus faecalis 06-MB-DW-09]|nr:hypothetical protein D931_01352 [Enterococcus faecium 13.SD.W.09]EPH95766.1 hypothetical protein D922_01121 [Enterococcus faecalis 06-MB-DW-09]
MKFCDCYFVFKESLLKIKTHSKKRVADFLVDFFKRRWREGVLS